VTASLGAHGVNVSGSLTIQYDSGSNGGQLIASGTVVGALPAFGNTTMTAELYILNGRIQSFTLTANKTFSFLNALSLQGTISFSYSSGSFSASGSANISIFSHTISSGDFEIKIKDGAISKLKLFLTRSFNIFGATIGMNASGEYSTEGYTSGGKLTIKGTASLKTPDSWPWGIRNRDLASVGIKVVIIPDGTTVRVPKPTGGFTTVTGGGASSSYIQGWTTVLGQAIGGTAYFDGRIYFTTGDPIPLDLEQFPHIQTDEDVARAYLAASNGYAHIDDVNVTNEQVTEYLHKEMEAEELSANLVQSGVASVTSGAAISITDVVKQGVGAGQPEFFDFTVNLADAPSGLPVTVSYATEDATAIAANGDYTPTSGTLTWLPGDTAPKTIRVQAHPRLDASPHKLFVVRLSAPENASIASGVAVGDILYSHFDTTTSLSLSNPNALLGEPVIYTATVSHGGAGFVRFYDNGELLDFATVENGVATFTQDANRMSAGDHVITAEFTGWQIPGYSHLSSVSPEVVQTIRAAEQTIAFDPLEGVDYGSDAVLLNATASSNEPVEYRLISGPASIQDNVLTLTGIGEVIVEAYRDADEHYLAAEPVRQSFLVYPATLTYVVGNPAIAFGESLDAAGGSYEGFVNGDDFSVILTAPTLTTDRPIDGAGFYTLSADGAEAENYFIRYVPGMLTVTRIASGVTLDSLASFSQVGETVTLTARVVGGFDGYAPTGEIVFLDGGVPLGTAPIVNGIARFTWTAAEGTHAFSAAFAGDGNFAPAESQTQSLRVVRSLIDAQPATLVGAREFAIASGNTVRYYDPNGSEVFRKTLPTGDIRTVAADFNGDGLADFVAASGPGGASLVTIYDGATGEELHRFAPFESTFTGGVYVAAGDLDGDGIAELVVTAGNGGGPRVQIYRGPDFEKIADFFGIDDPNFRGGARAAVGDITGDGIGDLTIAAGEGGGPRVSIYDGRMLSDFGRLAHPIHDFFIFEPALRNGAVVALGDLNGDGFADLIGGAGFGGAPRVLALSGADLLENRHTALANFFAGSPESRDGVELALKNLDADDAADLLVADRASGRVTSFPGRSLVGGVPMSDLDLDLAGIMVG